MHDDYISRERLWLDTKNKLTHNNLYSRRDFFDIIREVPAANVSPNRPVILCKDCDNWNEWDHTGRQSLGSYRCSCGSWSVEGGPVFYTAPEDFCSYAEPKDKSDERQT